jgi:hypothetical protein
VVGEGGNSIEVVTDRDIYYSDAPLTVQPVLDALRRETTFEEVVSGLDESNALLEARRCLSCGNCFDSDRGTDSDSTTTIARAAEA